MHTCSVAPHSLVAAESEDVADVDRLPVEVAAVQSDANRPVAQFTQRQGHGTEVQQTTAEVRHTQITAQERTNIFIIL